MKLLNVLAVLILSTQLFACGSAGGNVDPLTLFNEAGIPTLDSILPTGQSFVAISSGYSSTNPYWTFSASNGFQGGNYIAPASGIVTRVGADTLNGSNVTSVTTIHSGRMATKMLGMQVIQVREGDSVVAGQVIGTFVNAGVVGFQVILDGSAVCPLSFMSETFRTRMAGFFGANPCL